MQHNINLQTLKSFAPVTCPAVVFRPADLGSPQQDWARHLAANPLYRRELEEFAVLGETVVRFADGVAPEAADRVKLLSLSFAVNALGNETDAREFVRSVKAIASPDASQFELEQIAAFYLKEIRQRGSNAEVLKEMGMLGVHLQAVTAPIEDRELTFFETDASPLRLTVAEERRSRELAADRPPLPAATPNFDDELAAVLKKIRRHGASSVREDDFAAYYLADDDKTWAELEADYETFNRLQQYDENGLISSAMTGGQHPVVMFDFESEIDAHCLPAEVSALASEIRRLFIGHGLGGVAAAAARAELRGEEDFLSGQSDAPLSDAEFSDWLDRQLGQIYARRQLRTVRRLTADGFGRPLEIEASVEINPDFEEMTYVDAVCRLIWSELKTDFHLRSLRRRAYQELHCAIRAAHDTAELAALKKRAYRACKEEKILSLKEFTALNTAAKSQEARISMVSSALTDSTLRDIAIASANRLRFLKYFLYNDAAISQLTRQEKQRLWDAVRARETMLLEMHSTPVVKTPAVSSPQVVRPPATRQQAVRIYPQRF